MFLKFSVENFFSFYEKQEISFDHEYNSADIYKNNTIFEYKDNKKKRAVLNGAIILGANAAGKSNIVNALSQMSTYYLDSLNYDKATDVNLKIKEFSFLGKNDKPIVFEIEFMENSDQDFYKIKYKFSINYKSSIIENEKLSYQKVLKSTLSQEKVIFERTKNSVENNPEEINNIINKIKQENIKYKLVLSLINFDINETFFNNEISTLSFKIAELCGLSLAESLVFSNKTANRNDFIEQLDANPSFKEYILNNLYKFDFALTDFDIQDISGEVIDAFKNFNLFDEKLQEKIVSQANKTKRYRVKTIHNVDDKEYKLPITDESAGTQKFLNHSLKIYESILMGKTYISDEFDSHYHIHIQEGIINNFLYPESPSKTQFLLITHNPLLLNPNFFAKEQIYFVEKDREKQSSYIYSLKDFENISYNNHSWINLYLSGRFGGIPEVFD